MPGGELVNWLPVCKSKSLFLKVLARLNSGIQIILWFNGIYDSKLELTKPNRLNQLLEHDKIISDQASRWKKAHFKRRSNSSFFFLQDYIPPRGYGNIWCLSPAKCVTLDAARVAPQRCLILHLRKSNYILIDYWPEFNRLGKGLEKLLPPLFLQW